MTDHRSPGTLIYTGSTKDIFAADANELLFRFSDRYSIFDWGQMPDAIPGKGVASAQFAIAFFELLEAHKIPHHYLGRGPTNDSFLVREAESNRNDPEYFQSRPTHAFVPLEVIFRLGVPVGSSLLKRYKTLQDWQRAGFDRAYSEGEKLPHPLVECTTKWEPTDRFVDATEAKKIAHLNDAEWNGLQSLASQVAVILRERFAENGAELWDGKIEIAFLPAARDDEQTRQFQVVDSLGLDEIRLTLDGRPLSKEILRQHYLSSKWFAGLQDAKQQSRDQFKKLCLSTVGGPEPLPVELLRAVTEVYRLSPALLETPRTDTREKIETLRKELQIACASFS